MRPRCPRLSPTKASSISAMSEPTHVRASALKTARRCWRRVRFDDLYRVETQTDATRLGTAVHLVAELWHAGLYVPQKGVPEDDIFLTGLRFNPPPGTHAAEWHFATTIKGVPYSGTIDLSAAGSVMDHKTSSNPAAYALTEPDMREDPQVVLYSAIMRNLYGLDVRAKWIYYPTRGGKALARQVYWESEKLAEAFLEHVHAPAKRLYALRLNKTEPLALEPNYDACMDFNRPCAYIQQCNSDRRDNMSFLDELDAPATATEQDEFDFDASDAPATWENSWAIVPPNVKPEFHARARKHYEAKGTPPADAYRGLLTRQGGKLTEAQVISIGAQLDPFATALAAPKANGKPAAAINPPKQQAKAKAAAAPAEAPAAAAATLTPDQILIRNTIVATRCVPVMQDADIDALISFATKVASKL